MAYVGYREMITNLTCTGGEDDLSLCSSHVDGYCDSGYAVKVDCSKWYRCQKNTINILES